MNIVVVLRKGQAVNTRRDYIIIEAELTIKGEKHSLKALIDLEAKDDFIL